MMSQLSLVIVGKEITSWKTVSDWRDFLEEIAVSEWSKNLQIEIES